MRIYNSKHIKKPVLDFMKFSYIFTLIVLAIMNITLFICVMDGIDSKPRNETSATTANASLSSITISDESLTSTLPSVDADKGHVKSNLSERNTQWLKQKRHITCGCNFSKTTGCSNFRSVFDSVSRYDKGKEHQFYDNTFPLFNMTANEKESATNIFTPYIIDNSFDFRIEKPLYLSWLLFFLHNLCTETVPSKIMSACKSDRWLEPASNIYNCRKRLDWLARDYFPDGIGILENNKDGFTIHTLIDRIIKKIDSDINECLDKILSQNQKANVASYYAEAVQNKSIYDILDKDRRKYSSVVLPKHTRRKRNIKFTVTSNQKTETSNQGNSGHEINKQLDPDVKTRLNRVLQEESSGSSGVIQ